MIKKIIMTVMITTSLFSLPVDTMAASSETLIDKAKTYIGVPYRFGGTSPKGFDCSGFTQLVFLENDIKLPRTAAEQFQIGKVIKKNNLQKGDLVFFETYKKGPSHIGVYIGEQKFIHASSANGVTISSLNNSSYWQSRYLGAKRVQGIVQGLYMDIAHTHWAYEAISFLSEKKLVSSDNSEFKPNEPITRAEVVTTIARALNLDTTVKDQVYKDINKHHPLAGVLNALHKKGILFANEETNFSPDAPMSRVQLAYMLMKAFDLSKEINTETTFSDVPKTHVGYEAVQQLVAYDITKGHADRSFRPDDHVTRAQFAAFLYRVIQKG